MTVTTHQGRKTTHQGREIEIIAPKNQYGACVFTVNGQGPRAGERFTAELGKSAADVLAELKKAIDALDALGVEGIRGVPTWTQYLRPGSWEICPAPGLSRHIKPVDAPCNERPCKVRAAKAARRKALAAQKHPAIAGLTTQLQKAGFERANLDRPKPLGFKVYANDSTDRRKGVRVVWYPGGNMPLDAKPGRCQEIADFLTSKGVYSVQYSGRSRVNVVSKTHGIHEQ